MEPLRLSQWVRLLNKHSLRPIPYVTALKAVIAGALPAQNVRGRWYLHETDIGTGVEYFSARQGGAG